MPDNIKPKKGLIPKIEIEGKRIYLRNLHIKDISRKYISWLNDREVNKFLSVRNQQQSRATVKKYIRSFDHNNHKALLGIFCKYTKEHIGTVSFSHIDWKNNFGQVGICIGNKNYWRKGYGVEALECVKKIAFEKLGLNRLEAGVSEKNTASVRLFERAGFRIEGKLRQREKIGGHYMDCLFMGTLRSEYKAKKD